MILNRDKVESRGLGRPGVVPQLRWGARAREKEDAEFDLVPVGLSISSASSDRLRCPFALPPAVPGDAGGSVLGHRTCRSIR